MLIALSQNPLLDLRAYFLFLLNTNLSLAKKIMPFSHSGKLTGIVTTTA